MKKKEEQEQSDRASLPLPSSADLRGKQSVRATFKLTAKAIDAVSIVAVHLGIKQKSLFDHLIEDTQSLKAIAREMHFDNFKKLHRIQKTYVLSRKTLNSLEQTSKFFNAPRDALVEYSIQRLLPIIAKEREQHRKRKEILKEIRTYLQQGERILRMSVGLLGDDDPVCGSFRHAMRAGVKAYRDIESFVERGEIIENY